jgi:hypothetical protein
VRPTAWLTLVWLASGCSPPTLEACDRWAERWCQRLWLCVVEHSRANPDFVALHGASPGQCAELHGAACAAANSCTVTTGATERCLQATAAVQCQALAEAHDACLSMCP